ncbi:hypothetical protein [Dyella sp. 2HG41-7]|uniref:hypothetical protein n=1 Tax=Dyella sp. 2HG41-7 TaxID=2883239 RepID=UPI001F258AE2|nr:hypothetical protein [Dyella sp. 2HG41-7]
MSGFTVDFVSPMDFEYLAAEISYDAQVLCRVRNERSDRVLEVELFVDVVRKDRPTQLTVPLRDFMALLDDVGKEVADCRAD